MHQYFDVVMERCQFLGIPDPFLHHQNLLKMLLVIEFYQRCFLIWLVAVYTILIEVVFRPISVLIYCTGHVLTFFDYLISIHNRVYSFHLVFPDPFSEDF